jgi:hypothetical protein
LAFANAPMHSSIERRTKVVGIRIRFKFNLLDQG